MTEILLAITRVAVLLFLVSSMYVIGLDLTLRQVIDPLRNARRMQQPFATSSRQP